MIARASEEELRAAISEMSVIDNKKTYDAGVALLKELARARSAEEVLIIAIKAALPFASPTQNKIFKRALEEVGEE